MSRFLEICIIFLTNFILFQLENSDEKNLRLENIERESEGEYSCEVTDADFEVSSDRGQLVLRLAEATTPPTYVRIRAKSLTSTSSSSRWNIPSAASMPLQGFSLVFLLLPLTMFGQIVVNL